MKMRMTLAALAVALFTGAAEAESAWTLLEKGIKAYQKGNVRKAKAILEAAVISNSKCGDAYYYLGLIYEKGGNRTGAMERYRTVPKEWGCYSLAQERLGDMERQHGRLEPAEKHFAAAVGARPNADTWMQLGAVQLDRERFKEAEKSLGEAGKLTRNNYQLKEFLGRLFMQTERYKKALGEYDAIIKKFPSDGISRMNRALCLMELKRNDEAASEFEKVLKLDPYNVNAIKTLMSLWKDDLSKRGDWSELEQRLERVKKNPPKVRKVSGR